MTFTPCIRGFRNDGYAQVYILVTHKSQVGYIKQNAIVNKSQVKGNEIRDIFILQRLADIISSYVQMTNFIEFTSVSDVIRHLETGNMISFSEYFKIFITKMSRDGRDNSIVNYKCAYNSFLAHTGKKELYFTDITSNAVIKWIDSLRNTKNAKSKYPTHLKAVFNAGKVEYNDYDNGIIKIKHDPFARVKIPPPDLTEHRSVDIETLREIFFHKGTGRAELASDVSLIIFGLAGINTADLYDLKKESLDGWVLKYRRKKTRSVTNKAYMEITVPEILRDLFIKYKGKSGLFKFSEMYSTPDDFNKAVNKGLKQIKKGITTYTLRHSWATIAYNNFNATSETVGLCLVHTQNKITDRYIKKNFSKVDELNGMIIKEIASFHNEAIPSDHVKL